MTCAKAIFEACHCQVYLLLAFIPYTDIGVDGAERFAADLLLMSFACTIYCLRNSYKFPLSCQGGIVMACSTLTKSHSTSEHNLSFPLFIACSSGITSIPEVCMGMYKFLSGNGCK